MKPIKRTVALASIVLGIIVFWLMPGINKANDTYYTRRYENTEAYDSLRAKAARKKPQEVNSRPEKIYKKERIHSSARIKEIHPKMFSRAIHFEEETADERAKMDSTQKAQAIKVIKKEIH